MSTGWWIQIFVNVVLVLGVAVLWFRLRRPPQDDPRLSRGLQLLQSKISVLEDLSDRTDAQVKQLTTLIEQKARLLQNKVIEAEHQIQRVDQSMRRSKEVAEIFQDKIPHEEIIERQNTIKYVKAAKLANSGKSVAEIAAEVDLPEVQIELIAKLNKDQLVFDAEALPEWAQTENVESGETNKPAVNSDLTPLFTPPQEEYSSLKRLGEEFRNACVEFDRKKLLEADFAAAAPEVTEGEVSSSETAAVEDPSVLMEAAKRMTAKIVATATDFLGQESTPNAAPTAAAATATKPAGRVIPPSLTTPPQPFRPAAPKRGMAEIRKVAFPKVEAKDNLS